MKQNALLGAAATLVVAATMIYACRQEPVEPAGTSAETTGTANARMASYRALTRNGSSVNARLMTLNINDEMGIVHVTTNTVPQLPSDRFMFYSPDVPIMPNGSFMIPMGGSKYWRVPFNSSDTPMQLTAPGYSNDCGCLSSPLGPAQNSNCQYYCNGYEMVCEGTCTDGDGSSRSCGPLSSVSGGPSIGHGSYVLVKANVLVYNSVVYQ